MQRKPRLGNLHLEAEFGLLGFTLGVVVCMNKAAFPQVQRLLHSGLTELLCERECVDTSLSDVFPQPVLSDKMSRLKHVSEGPSRFLW